MTTKTAHQTQLWLGTHDNLTANVIIFLQQHFCSQAGCGICTTCRQIREQQYHAVIWIYPEKTYTLETLNIIQERIAFALDNNQSCFFILQKADLLTTQCANSLLKSIEEPPQGYHFILCAERKEYIIPTVLSRCTLRSFAKDEAQTTHQTLYAYFTAQKPQHAAPFLTEIQNSSITEHESLDLTDQLLAYWMKQYKQKKQTIDLQRVELFKKALLKPPMPGSSKIFWKNIFLRYHSIV